jgi:YcaO cyclodehydratase, ATP-ad Mg2+-binding
MASSHRPAVAAILSDIGFGGGYRALRGAADLVSRIAPSRSNAGPQAAASWARGATSKSHLRNRHCHDRLHHRRTAGAAHCHECSQWLRDPSGARIVLTCALTEAAQTRLTCIQGGREDLPDLARTGGAAPAETWYNGGHSISFYDIASYQHPTINDDVEFIVERMRQFGFDQVVVPPCAPRRAADCRAPRESRLRGRSASGKFGDPDDRSLYSLVRMQLFRDRDDVPTS